MILLAKNSQGFTVVYATPVVCPEILTDGPGYGKDVVEAREIGMALRRILATPAFIRSPRLAEFLRYVVEQRLAGRAEGPKEVEIGAEVFGRPPDYDPRIDPVVRVQARLLRYKLHEYYETVGKADSLRIDLPKGAYSASFSSGPASGGMNGSASSETSGSVPENLAGVTPPPAPPALPAFAIDAAAPPASLAQPDSTIAPGQPPGVSAPLTPPASRGVKIGWILAAALIGVALISIASWNAWRGAIGKVWAKTLPVRPKAAQSPAAELYLKGRFYWNKRTPEDLQKAVDYFTQSIVADPGYAKAYVGLADCYGLLREFAAMPDSEAWPRALAAARKAVELDDSLAEAHSSLGFDLFYGSLDLKGGEHEFKRAVELNPNYAQAHHWYATALMSVGRFQEASDEMERARELDPASRAILSDQALLLFYEGRRAQAIEQLHQIEAAEPFFRSAHSYLAYIYLNAKDAPNYLLESRKAAESANDATGLAVVAAGERGFTAGGSAGMLESLYAVQTKLVNQGSYPAFDLAVTSALLGRKKDALNNLNTSYAKHEINILTLPIVPALLSLHQEPSYQHLVAQLGLDAPN